MSEEQKDGGVAGAANKPPSAPATAQVSELAGAHAGAEIGKPKRRATAKAKAAADTGDETVKPKRARTSSRSSKAKNVLTEALPNEDVQPADSQGKDSSSRSEPGHLPPLPPAPVPTPEGIAFMQQHIAFQNALEQRAELRRTELERSSRSLKVDPEAAVSDPRKPRVQSAETAFRAPAQAHDAGASEGASEAKVSIAKGGKAEKENVIEAGRDIRLGPVSETDLLDLRDAEDARLLRQLLERSRALREQRNATTAEPAAAIAQSDVGTIRMIRDAAARKLGLAVVDRNRHEEPEYKVAFDRLAPELKVEAQDANIGKPTTIRSSGVLLDKADDDATRLMAIPESVRKRFLKVDSDYYFPDRSPAFVDRGARLATRGEHPEVIVALVAIAKERGWNSVSVKGSEIFRRAAWMEAARNGLQVAGYKPTELDLAQLNQREPTNQIEPGALREQGRAYSPSSTRPVDRDLSEKLSAFANEKPTLAVKKYPDLVQAYALLDAARKFAEAHMSGYEKQFVAIGKEMITQQLWQGKEVVGPKVHPDQIGQSRSGKDRSDSRAEKTSQSEVLVRER